MILHQYRFEEKDFESAIKNYVVKIVDSSPRNKIEKHKNVDSYEN